MTEEIASSFQAAVFKLRIYDNEKLTESIQINLSHFLFSENKIKVR